MFKLLAITQQSTLNQRRTAARAFSKKSFLSIRRNRPAAFSPNHSQSITQRTEKSHLFSSNTLTCSSARRCSGVEDDTLKYIAGESDRVCLLSSERQRWVISKNKQTHTQYLNIYHDVEVGYQRENLLL